MTIYNVVAAAFFLVGLIPWLMAADRKGKQAKELTTSQQLAIYNEALREERDDLKAKVAELEHRADVQDQVIAELRQAFREATRRE